MAGPPGSSAVETAARDGVLVATITGEIDVATVNTVGTALVDMLDKNPAGLVVDLAVTFIGSVGLSMLLELYGRTQRSGTGFAIVAVERRAHHSLVVSGLSEVLPLAESVEDAVEALRQSRI